MSTETNNLNMGDIHESASSVTLPGDSASTQAGSTVTADNVAPDVTSDQAQVTDTTKPETGAATTGSNPLKTADETQELAPIVKDAPQEGEIKLDAEGLPVEGTPFEKVRGHLRTVLADNAELKTVAAKVTELGGLAKIQSGVTLYDALASTDYQPEQVLTALRGLSEQRYAALINKAFEQHQDVFLTALGLDPQQFQVAAHAVKEGRGVTEDDLKATQIPFGIAPDAWENMDESAQEILRNQAKANADQQKQIKEAQDIETARATKEAQGTWSTAIENKVNEAFDQFKISDETPEGKEIREKIRRNCWAAISSLETYEIGKEGNKARVNVRDAFYGALQHFNDGNVQFALNSQAVLEQVMATIAHEEASYYDQVNKLKAQVDQLKLKIAGGRIDVTTGDAGEEISTHTYNDVKTNGIDPANIFDRESIRSSSNQVLGRK